MIQIPIDISIDDKGDRWIHISGKDPTLPKGREVQTTKPNTLVPVRELREVIEQYRNGNQARVNEILTRYY